MRLVELQVAGYRSIRDLALPLGQVNVLTGANGCGKSNLYNSLYLLSRAAEGDLARTLAREGGMSSVLWAGPEGRRTTRKAPPRRVRIAILTDEFSYELQCGLPVPRISMFTLDPEIKQECVWHGRTRRKSSTLLERKGPTAWTRTSDGKAESYPFEISTGESVLAQLREPQRYPELGALRVEIRSWRFYHHFRTDPDSPLRQPQVGVQTPALAHDGSDVAAALQTIREIGDDKALARAIDRAFPGAVLTIESDGARLSLQFQLPAIKRPFDGRELSDGTLRYLCLVAALLSPRPPRLLALNEPEMSLHPELLEPLAQLMVDASEHSQLWITTHSQPLADTIQQLSSSPGIGLEMIDGETRLQVPEVEREEW